MDRREIRKFIFKTVLAMRDLTRCMEPWGWTFSKGEYIDGYWSKTFTLSYPLLVKRYERFYLRQKVIIALWFSDFYVDLEIKPYPKSRTVCYSYSSYNIFSIELRLKTPLIFQKFAVELPKAIASAETEPFYDEVKQEQIKVIPATKLAAKIGQVFREIRKTFKLL